MHNEVQNILALFEAPECVHTGAHTPSFPLLDPSSLCDAY